MAFGDGVKVDAFRKILGDKAVDILNGTALPRALQITKVSGDFGGEGECGILGHFTKNFCR